MKKVPRPSCNLGYTREDLKKILGDDLERFNRWFVGQTGAICPEHGMVVYSWDLKQFLAGGDDLEFA